MIVLDELDRLSFCKGLPREYLERLVSIGEYRTYDKGERLFFEGQSSTLVFLLIEGRVSLETSLPGGEPMRFQTVEAGELLGWSPFLGLGVLTSTGRALMPCQVLALDTPRILAIGDKEPRFVLEFTRRVAMTLARRLNSTRRQLVERFCTDGQGVS